MKAIIISMLFVLLANISNAQFSNFDEFKIVTYTSKLKQKENSARILNDEEFQEIQKQFLKKKMKKLGETFINQESQGIIYSCSSNNEDDFDYVCLSIYEVYRQKELLTFLFKIINNKDDDRLKNINYTVNKKHNYILTINSSNNRSYTFLISPYKTTISSAL